MNDCTSQWLTFQKIPINSITPVMTETETWLSHKQKRGYNKTRSVVMTETEARLWQKQRCGYDRNWDKVMAEQKQICDYEKITTETGTRLWKWKKRAYNDRDRNVVMT